MVVLGRGFFFVFVLLSTMPNSCLAQQAHKQAQAQEEQVQSKLSNKKYFCSVADEKHYPWLLNLIGSIHKNNWENLEQIAIIDLGFTQEQRATLNTMEHVCVYDLDVTHPLRDDLLTPFLTSNWGKKVRGWFAWKPVVIKQALDMFDYVFYLDAGCVVLKPLDNLFKYIQEKDHFLVRDQEWFVGGQSKLFTIGEQCTRYVLDKFNLLSPENQWILHEANILPGIQGVSRAIYDSYVMPMYEFTKDLKIFEDDGSSMYGFGWARHDQTIYSIFVRLYGFEPFETQKEVELEADGKKFTVHCCDYAPHNPDIFYNCKGGMNFADDIRYKKEACQRSQ